MGKIMEQDLSAKPYNSCKKKLLITWHNIEMDQSRMNTCQNAVHYSISKSLLFQGYKIVSLLYEFPILNKA